MRGSEFLDKMELVSAAYLEAADSAPKGRKKIRMVWRAAMAACICLVLLAGTAAAASGRGIWLIEMFTDKELGPDYTESGYTVGLEIRKFQVSELSAEIQAAGEQIMHQFSGYFPYSSQYPGSWRKDFSSAAEARDFVGLDLLKQFTWDVDEDGTTLLLWGTSSGKIKTITIDTIYRSDDIVLQANTEIYTEYSDGEDGQVMVRAAEKVEFMETFYTTASGKPCQIVSSVSPTDSGYLMMDGYLVDEGIRYTLFVRCLAQDAARAEALLYQWADMF